MKKTLLSLLLCATLSQAPLGAALLSDTFTDNDRTNQSLPGSAAWFSGGLSGDASVSGGQLLASNIANNNRGFMAYFTASGSPVTLAVGQSLVLTAQVQTIGATGGDARFQFWAFNSGGSRIAADNHNFNNATFIGYTGYGITNDPAQSNITRYQIRERASGANSLLANQTTIGPAAQSINMTSSLTDVSLTLHRTGATEMTITGSIGGTPISRTDTTGIFTSFDSIGIMTAADTLSGNLVIDNVVVIPEPGTFALLAVSALSLLLVFRRKRG